MMPRRTHEKLTLVVIDFSCICHGYQAASVELETLMWLVCERLTVEGFA